MKEAYENNNTNNINSIINNEQYIHTPGNKSNSSINNILNQILYFSINQDSK